MVDRPKRMLTKEKIDKQLAGQTSSTPFMNLRDSQGKKISFKMHDNLEQKRKADSNDGQIRKRGWWMLKTI